MSKRTITIDKVRASRAGHTYHERWAARRALQLVFPKDNLFSIVVEGLSPNESLNLGKKAEDIADLVLYYGDGDTFAKCEVQQVLQFKYKVATEAVTSSYLKKTIKKFAAALFELRKKVSGTEEQRKLTFGFVTNAQFREELLDAIRCLQHGGIPKSRSAKQQMESLKKWCKEEKVTATDLFPLIEFNAGTADLPAQDRRLRRTVSDWSGESSGQAAKRLNALVELVREKAQVEGQGRNAITREDVLDALECDEDQLFPADTRFLDVGRVIERGALKTVTDRICAVNMPILLHAEGGVGKTVFIRSLANHLLDRFEVVIFDCFGGGSYRNEAQARHQPRIGLLQIVNELAARGLCDPLLPFDADAHGLIDVAKKRLRHASETVRNQSSLDGILIVIDAADNAQLEADRRGEAAFPRLLLAALSEDPLEGVKLLMTARPERMAGVIGRSQVEEIGLDAFSQPEARQFLQDRRGEITTAEFSTAWARSRGNARVLEYLVESWDVNVSGEAPQSEISVEELIAERCKKIFDDLFTAGWSENQITEFFTALSLLPPPVPLSELAQALGWSESHVQSAASDLAPMLELTRHGAIFRDEPTETYIHNRYATETTAQQAIAERLQGLQALSVYAAESLPHFLVVIGDSERAYRLASSDEFPKSLESEYGKRRLRLARLSAAFSLSTRENDLDRTLRLSLLLSQVSSANARGDQFIRHAPGLAIFLGDPDVSRRLFNDRSGWRGARDTRLVVAHGLLGDLDEARIHQQRAIGWINWYLRSERDHNRVDQDRFASFDVAAVLMLSVIEGEFSSFNRNIRLWNFRFALQIVEELIRLCIQNDMLNDGTAFKSLVAFASSRKCESLALQIGLLANEWGLTGSENRSTSRALSGLCAKFEKETLGDSSDYKRELQVDVSLASIASLINNSLQSAKRVYGLCKHRRPTCYDYGERHGLNSLWPSVLSACASAWSAGEKLSYHHLVPEPVKQGRSTKTLTDASELRALLEKYEKPERDTSGKAPSKKRQKHFSSHEIDNVATGISCVLRLVAPIEREIISNNRFSSDTLHDHLRAWKEELRPEVHLRAESARDHAARHIGLGLTQLLLRHSTSIAREDAEDVVQIVSQNRFTIQDKLDVFSLLARRSDLADVTGGFAQSLSSEILRDDYIEQRSGSFRELSQSLIPLSTEEAKEYYARGLEQLDQMGGDDFDMVYSLLHYAAEQPGGHLKPELAHRFMGLCQTIFQHEPAKFGWALFGRAAAASIGFPAVYKLIRWSDQDVAEFSYGLPQLSCFLAKSGHLDPRRAAVITAICQDHGWHEWQVGNGLKDILTVAESEDRARIFSSILSKIGTEHSTGGWESLWEGLLECVTNFSEIDTGKVKERLESARDLAKRSRDRENARLNGGRDYGLEGLTSGREEDNSADREEAFKRILEQCFPISTSSLDTAIQKIHSSELTHWGDQRRLFGELISSCPYQERSMLLGAICETSELEFDQALDQIIGCVEAWKGTTTHISSGIKNTIETLFSHKGSQLFDLRFSGVSRQIHRLSELTGDRDFVMKNVLLTIARERLELGGDEWLQVATSLCNHTNPTTALEAFEDFLSSSTAKVGEEIGEGKFQAEFAGRKDEDEMLADIVWHLLGDSDAFVRWRTARGIETMVWLDLLNDVSKLLDRFDISENKSLASDEHYFAYLNSQQWLLMGLSRAALNHGAALSPLRSRLQDMAKRSDVHLLNKLHFLRILSNIDGGSAFNPDLDQLREDVLVPPHGVVESEGYPDTKARNTDFRFDYEFDKYEVSDLARLFGISQNEASDYIADEVLKRWPGKTGMCDFPGGTNYGQRTGDRTETFREHVQRHALNHAATTLLQMRPAVCSRYGWDSGDPWGEFLRKRDVSFEDGSWLSDHKDEVPDQALAYLLGKRDGSQETLQEQASLMRKIGLSQLDGDRFFPVYGHWTSPDGVHVRISSALTARRGAVGRCAKFSKNVDHEMWLPMYGSDGRLDRFREKGQFEPLIWEPESYPIGIDNSDELAASGVIARPRLGRAINSVLGLRPDQEFRQWIDQSDEVVLNSVIWGEWTSSDHDYRRKSQDEGAILWANRSWLDRVLDTCRSSLVYVVNFSKYKSSRSYDDSSGVRQVYVALRPSDEEPRFWFARKASETVY